MEKKYYKRLDLIRRNNTLYISGQKDPINYYPTDDISIKGPNLNSNLNNVEYI